MSIDQTPNQGKPSENSVPNTIATNEFTEEEKQKIMKQIDPKTMGLALDEFKTTEEKFIQDLESAGVLTDYIEKKYLSAGKSNDTLFTKEEEEKIYRVNYALKEMYKLQALQRDFFKALFDPSEGYLENPDQEKAKKLMEQYDRLGTEEGKLCRYYEKEKILEIAIPDVVKQDQTVRDQTEKLGIQPLLTKAFQHFLKLQLKLNEVTKSMPQTDERFLTMQELNEKVRKMQSSVNEEIKKKEIPPGDMKITLKFDGNKNGKETAIKQMTQAKNFLTKALEANLKGTEMAEKKPIGLTMPVGYTISGEKTSFTVKKGTIPLWEIKISGSSLTIQELSRENISKEDSLEQLKLMDQFIGYLNIYTKGSLELNCPNLDKIKTLIGLSASEYQIGKKEENALLVYAETLNKQIDQTADKHGNNLDLFITLPDIRPNDNIIREIFQGHMDKGFIPRMAELGKYGKGELEIKTKAPALAIKQAEAALAAGFEFTFSEPTKKQIQAYVREEVKTALESGKIAKQINILETDPQSIVDSVIEVANNGLLAKLDSNTEKSLREFFAKQVDLDPRYDVSLFQADTFTALQFREMAQRGFLPDLYGQRELANFREKVGKIEGKINESFVINSGNTLRDIQVLQFATQLGLIAQISFPEEVCQSASKMENPPSVDLRNMSPDLQRKQIAYFAEMGFNAIVSKSVEKESIEIETFNSAHAAVLYASYLDQGFEPHFKQNAQVAIIRELMNGKVEIDLKNQKDPALLLDQLNKIVAQGFSPILSNSQRKMLSQYVEKQGITSPLIISGYRSEVAWSNQQLAHELGLEVVFDSAALSTFAEDQQRHREQGKPLPQKEIQAVKNKGGKIDMEKTFQRAERLLATGYVVRLPRELNDVLANMAEMTVGQKDKNKMKAAQVTALKWNQFINKNEANKAQFNQEVQTEKPLKMQSIDIIPVMKQRGGFLGLGSKAEIDKDATLRLARSFSQQGISLKLTKECKGLSEEINKLNAQSQAYAEKWRTVMQEVQATRELPPEPIEQQEKDYDLNDSAHEEKTEKEKVVDTLKRADSIDSNDSGIGSEAEDDDEFEVSNPGRRPQNVSFSSRRVTQDRDKPNTLDVDPDSNKPSRPQL